MISCEFCKKELEESTILKHIAQNEACKSHYGPEKLQKMKRNKEKLRKRQYRQGLSIDEKEKITKKKREYDRRPERKQKRKEIRDAKEKKRMEEALEKKRKREEKEIVNL